MYRSKGNSWLPDEDVGSKLSRIDWENEKVVLYYGKYLWTKGLQHLIAAAPLLLMRQPQTKFVLVGFGEGREFFEAMVGALDKGRLDLFARMLNHPAFYDPKGAAEKPLYLKGLQDGLSDLHYAKAYEEICRDNIRQRVVLTGIMNHFELRQLIPCADLTVAPSIFPEAFGLVAVEALACGVLLVQTYHSGFADVIKVYMKEFGDIFRNLNLESLYLSDELVPKLACHLTGLLEYLQIIDEDQKQELRHRAHDLVKQEFSWKRVAEKYLEGWSRT